MNYNIIRGGHEDLNRIYPMMTFDFESWELPKESEFHAAMLKGAELLLLKDGTGLECGYAMMLKSRGDNYVLLGWLGVYPNVRGNGIGGKFLSCLREYYSALGGILLVVLPRRRLPRGRDARGAHRALRPRHGRVVPHHARRGRVLHGRPAAHARALALSALAEGIGNAPRSPPALVFRPAPSRA